MLPNESVRQTLRRRRKGQLCVLPRRNSPSGRRTVKPSSNTFLSYSNLGFAFFSLLNFIFYSKQCRHFLFSPLPAKSEPSVLGKKAFFLKKEADQWD
jgi:hypothetical protein